MTRHTPELETAYRRALYRVDDAGRVIELRIGTVNSAGAELLQRHGVTGAALVTACNPGSRPTPAAQNGRAQRALEDAVAAAGHRWLPAAGLDPDGVWPVEPSLLILGIDRHRAAELARRFGQAALLWLGADGAPELDWT